MKRMLTLLLALVALWGIPAMAASATLTTNATACPGNGGSSTSTSALVLGLADKGGATLTVGPGTWTGTISFYGTGSGGQLWTALLANPLGTTSPVTSTTTNGTWRVGASGITGICMLSSASMTGSVTVTITPGTPASLTNNGSGGSITGGADVLVAHSNGTSTAYYAGAYGTAALALNAACSAAADQDVIYLANESYDFGSTCTGTNYYCDLSGGGTITASLHGSGPLTVVKRACTNSPYPSIVLPGVNHSRVTDMTITAYESPGSGADVPVLNRLPSSTYYDVTDFGMERLVLNGQSDGYIITPASLSSGYIRDSTISTTYDSQTFNGSVGTTNWTIDNTQTSTTPDSTNHLATCWRVLNSGTTNVTFLNTNTCTITGSDSAATIRGLSMESTGTNTFINLGVMKIDTSGVTTSTVLEDINMTSTSTLNLNLPNAIYNWGRVKNAGTINWCGTASFQNQQNCVPGLFGGIIGGTNVAGSALGVNPIEFFSDAATGNYVIMPTDVWLVNPAITTSNTNGTAPLAMQIAQNLGSSNSRQPGIAAVAANAVAGTYVNKALLPALYTQGSMIDPIGVLSGQTNVTLATPRGITYNIVGTQNTIIGTYPNTTVGSSVTDYIGFSNPTFQTSGNEALAQTIIPVAYSISNLCVYLSVAQGAGTLTFTLDKGGVATSLVVTVPSSGGAGPYCNNATAVTGGAGDLLDVKVVNGLAGTSGTIVAITAQLLPTQPATGALIFGMASSTLTSGQLNNVPPFSGVASTTTILNTQVGLPRAVKIRNLYCNTTTCPGAAATATVMKNGVATALTVTIPTSSCTTESDTSDIISFAAGDQISLQEHSASSTAPVITSCSVEHD